MTQSAPVKSETLALQTAKELNITQSYLQLVKDTFAKGATDDELSLFLRTASRTGLDPMARQLFLVKRWDSSLGSNGAMAMSIQISIDGFRLIADRTNKYVPGRETTYTYNRQGTVESATAYIKKLAGGIWHEISATAFYSEYVQVKKDKTPNSMWQKMPRLMLAKCAESLVLRKAFPAELSGLYTPEEMGNDAPVVNSVSSLEREYEQTKFEDYHEEKTGHFPITPKTEIEIKREGLESEIKTLCGKLNDAGDLIVWKSASLNEYVNDLFSVDGGLKDLDFESMETLIGDLTGRLESLAIQAIEGEVV